MLNVVNGDLASNFGVSYISKFSLYFYDFLRKLGVDALIVLKFVDFERFVFFGAFNGVTVRLGTGLVISYLDVICKGRLRSFISLNVLLFFLDI